jgi:two-component system sensor histidine kinase CreC
VESGTVKIRTALFRTYVIASAVGLAVLMRFVLAEVRPRYVTSIERTMEDSARLLAATLGQQAESEWPRTFVAMGKVASGVRVGLEDATGTLLFESRAVRGTAAGEAALKDYKSAKERISFLIDRHPFIDDGELVVRASIGDRQSNRGRVVLSQPLRSVNALIWSERKKLTIGALLLAAVMVALGWWLSRKLTASLERLATYAAAVRDGREARPPASRVSEIAAVSEAMEGMKTALAGKAHVEFYTQNLAHEIKAPLSGIRAAAELLMEDMSGEDRTRFLTNLRKESERVHQIVDRMLRLAALESRMELERSERLEPFEIAAVVDDVVAAAVADAEMRGVTIEVARGDMIGVVGERFLIHQALANLLQNAVSFAPSGTVIRVGWGGHEREVEVGVEDEGAGVPDYAHARIFERFYSLPRPETGRKGTGLGLNFVREIVALLHGSAGLTNRPEGGARAWIRWPRTSGARASVASVTSVG